MLNRNNTIIFVIVILAFIGSNLLFWRVNTGVLRQSIEAESNMFAAFLADDLNEVQKEGKAPAARLSAALPAMENRTKDKSDAWIIGTDGSILDEEGNATGENFFDRVGLTAGEVEKGLEVKDETPQKKPSFTLWLGKEDRILLRQKCCVIRALDGGRQYLAVMDHGDAAKALQRRQFSRLMVIDVFLLLILCVLIFNNSTRYRRQLIRFATTDELTGLANRKSFNEEFQEYSSVEHRGEGALFLLDIDFFKQINDRYGHAAGDGALRYLGGELRQMTKALHGFAGRWGGDEFIGVLPVPAEHAYEELERLCRRVEKTPMGDGFSMTVSIGVIDAAGETRLSKLTEGADKALYEAKENGRNQACLYNEERTEARVDLAQTGQKHTAAMAVAKAEDVSISSATTGEAMPEHVAGERLPVRERLKSYVQDKLIMSTVLGVRWMAPFVAGGGILIALAFLFDAASVDLTSLSVEERANLGSMTPIAATLKELGGITFNFMLPVFAGFMAYGIAGEQAFLAGFVGGYMTIDSNAGFVGAMVAGFVAGVIANEMQQFMRHMPRFFRNAAPIILFPVFSLLLMKLLSVSLITPVSSAIGTFFTELLTDVIEASPAAGGLFSAMMMATDMGGIINKVAYNYGVDAIASGGTDIMAAVMVGGMVPPVGIALSMVFFRRKYTKAEFDRGPVTLFMGLSFITEGALPYVFTDIRRVIPACMAGSAVAGLLSELFGCTLPAPHGGIFVFPIMGHPLLYAVALLAGALVTAFVLGALKQEKDPGMPEAE